MRSKAITVRLEAQNKAHPHKIKVATESIVVIYDLQTKIKNQNKKYGILENGFFLKKHRFLVSAWADSALAATAQGLTAKGYTVKAFTAKGLTVRAFTVTACIVKAVTACAVIYKS